MRGFSLHIVRLFPGESRGVSLVEFALLAPLLMMILLGMLGYGQYFLIAHSAQQLANDAARATISGMSPAERLSLANAAMASELPNLPSITANNATLTVTEALPSVTVHVRVDASAIGLFRVSLLPMPSSTIDRSAVIQQGGVL